MKYQKYEGVVINKRAVGDSDRFFTILTSLDGKISCYARGVRSIKSKRNGSLDYFSRINFEVVEKGGRNTLTHVELLDSYRLSKQALGNISRLFEIGELIDALVPEGEHTEHVYSLLIKALENLDRFETPEYLYRFKKRLLSYLGYGDRDLTPDNLDNYIESLLDRPLRTNKML